MTEQNRYLLTDEEGKPSAGARVMAVLDSRNMSGALFQREITTTADDGSYVIDTRRLERLAPLLPDARCVAESGLKSADDAATVAGWGYRLALVGSALMRSDDPAGLVKDMRTAGSARVAA